MQILTYWSCLSAGPAALSNGRLGASLIVGLVASALGGRDTCYTVGHSLPGRPFRVRAAAVCEQCWQNKPELGIGSLVALQPQCYSWRGLRRLAALQIAFSIETVSGFRCMKYNELTLLLLYVLLLVLTFSLIWTFITSLTDNTVRTYYLCITNTPLRPSWRWTWHAWTDVPCFMLFVLIARTFTVAIYLKIWGKLEERGYFHCTFYFFASVIILS